VYPGPSRSVVRAEGREELARSKHFVTERVELPAGHAFIPDAQRSQLWICLEGTAEIGDELVNRGEVWLLPDNGNQPAITALTPSRFLRTWAP